MVGSLSVPPPRFARGTGSVGMLVFVQSHVSVM